jgi:hypothetical protein
LFSSHPEWPPASIPKITLHVDELSLWDCLVSSASCFEELGVEKWLLSEKHRIEGITHVEEALLI